MNQWAVVRPDIVGQAMLDKKSGVLIYDVRVKIASRATTQNVTLTKVQKGEVRQLCDALAKEHGLKVIYGSRCCEQGRPHFRAILSEPVEEQIEAERLAA
jgi:aspartate/methionine/tyrosine aminotransferase